MLTDKNLIQNPLQTLNERDSLAFQVFRMDFYIRHFGADPSRHTITHQ